MPIGLILFLNSFEDLNSTRQQALNGTAALSVNEILDYGINYLKLDNEELDDFKSILVAIDIAYLDFSNE